jgi:MFS family permease
MTTAPPVGLSRTERGTPVRPRLVVASLALCGVLVAVLQTLMVPLLSSLPALVHTSRGTASWAVTATLLSGCVFTPVLGRVGDMFGKRRVLLFSLIALVLGSALCGMTSSIAPLLIGRGLQGVALASIPLGISIMRDELPPDRVLPSVALMSSTLGIGGAVGLPVSAVLVEYTNWHTMFWVSGAIGLIAIFMVLRYVPESSVRSRGKIDVTGAIGLGIILISVLLAFEKGSSWGWTSRLTLSCLALGLVLGLIWGWFELRVESPMVDLRISARPAVLYTNLAALTIGFAYFGNTLLTVQLIQEPKWTGYGFGLSIAVSGLCLLPGGIAMAVLSPVSARISRARGAKFTLGLAALVIVGGYVVRLYGSHDLAAVIVASLIISSGTGLAYSALPSLIMRAVPIGETGAANGLNTLMRSIGQSLCSAVAASVLASVTLTVAGQTAPQLHAYMIFFVIGGSMALVAFLITLLIPGRSQDGALAAQTAQLMRGEEHAEPGLDVRPATVLTS